MFRSCEKMTVTVPKITCEDETTELCQVLNRGCQKDTIHS